MINKFLKINLVFVLMMLFGIIFVSKVLANEDCSFNNCGNCSNESECKSVSCKWAGNACMPISVTIQCGNSNCSKCDDYSSCENAGCSWDGSDCRNMSQTTAEDSIIPDYPAGVDFKFKNAKVGEIFSGLLPYIYVIAGLILLVMLVMGGLGLMTAAGNPDKMKAGYGKITNALIGFLIVFVSYFVVQLVEAILGIKIM